MAETKCQLEHLILLGKLWTDCCKIKNTFSVWDVEDADTKLAVENTGIVDKN